MSVLRVVLFAVLVGCGGPQAEAPPEVPPEAPAAAPDKEAPANEAPTEKAPRKGKAGGVKFLAPEDGAKVKSPLTVRFGVKGMKVVKAGTLEENTGHHHLIIDGGPIPEGTAVPKDATHIHYGGGDTEATVELTPGEHTLTMQFADGNHLSYGEAFATTIKVTVEP